MPRIVPNDLLLSPLLASLTCGLFHDLCPVTGWVLAVRFGPAAPLTLRLVTWATDGRRGRLAAGLGRARLVAGLLLPRRSLSSALVRAHCLTQPRAWMGPEPRPGAESLGTPAKLKVGAGKEVSRARAGVKGERVTQVEP